jgi:bacterioferritin
VDPAAEKLIASLNEDLELEFRSITQYVQHVACVTGAEYTSTIDELKVHLGQELNHSSVLAEQIAFLGGTPTTSASEAPPFVDSRAALEADLELETAQLERYRRRVEEANEAGLPDVAEALRPLLTQTQEHVRDLQTALGK